MVRNVSNSVTKIVQRVIGVIVMGDINIEEIGHDMG